MIDTTKPVQLRDVNQPRIIHPSEICCSCSKNIFVKNLSNGAYWRFDYEGSSAEHPAWRLENAPPPKLRYEATLVWARDSFGGPGPKCYAFDNPATVARFIKTLGVRFISSETVSIEA